MLCFECNEPIAGHIDWITVSSGAIWTGARHRECALRAVVGGLNHQLGRCTCCGGTEPPDPREMTKREAALAAVAYYRSAGAHMTLTQR